MAFLHRPLLSLPCQRSKLLFCISDGTPTEVALYRTIPERKAVWSKLISEIRVGPDRCKWSSDGSFVIFPTEGIALWREDGAIINVGVSDGCVIQDAIHFHPQECLVIIHTEDGSLLASILAMPSGVQMTTPLKLPAGSHFHFHRLTPEGVEFHMSDDLTGVSSGAYLLSHPASFNERVSSSDRQSLVEDCHGLLLIVQKVTAALSSFGTGQLIEMYVQDNQSLFQQLLSDVIEPLGITLLGSKFNTLATSLIKRIQAIVDVERASWDSILQNAQEQWDHLATFMRSVTAAAAGENMDGAVRRWSEGTSPTALAIVVKIVEGGPSQLRDRLATLQEGPQTEQSLPYLRLTSR